MLSSSLRRISTRTNDASLMHARCTATAAVPKEPILRRSDLKRIKRTGDALIRGTKKANDPGWKHTYGKKKEFQRLEQELLVKTCAFQGKGARTIDSWSMEEFVESGSETQVLSPGTYFEIRRNTSVTNGVVITNVSDNVGYNEDTLSVNTTGEVFFHRSSDVMFCIPGFVDGNLVDRCGKNHMHDDQNQLAARIRVLKAAREFERIVEREQYRLGAVIQDVYQQVRSSNPDEWGKVTTMQVARMLEAAPNVPLVTLFAVHRLLMERADEFVCHPSRHRFVHSFEVRPFSHLRNMKSVKNMLHNNSPVIRNFQDKAKFLIARSRELAAQSKGQPPSRAEIVDHAKFTPKEQEIVTFLKLSLLQGRKVQEDSFAANVPAIIKDTFRYDEIITPYVTLKFLREIGVFTPWEDVASKDRMLGIPKITEEPVTLAAVHSSVAPTKERNEPTETPGLLETDPYESVRHDFGSLTVYVIDDATAEELDDGISIEAVPGEPESAWVHVHVADPTTFISITHPLSQQILKRSESLYFGHHIWPMLPDDISKRADMGRTDLLGIGQNVLTFSAKVGSDAQILDYKVRAGRVHNVARLQYDDVNAALFSDIVPSRFTPFEREYRQNFDPSKASIHKDRLKLLYDVTRRLVKTRLKQDIFAYSMNRPEIEFLNKPLPQNPTHVLRPILHRGFPRLRYHVEVGDAPEVGSRSMVAECMKLAGRVGSRFCLERNIPSARRAMPPIDIEREKLSRIMAARNDNGLVDIALLAKEGVITTAGSLTTKPLAHWLLGIPDGEGYLRTTSPLRRAEDMIMHWQIKSALLPGTSPPIDEVTMSRIIEDFNGRKHMIKKAYRLHTRQWAHEYIRIFMDEQKKAGTTKAGSNPLYHLDGYILQNPVYNLARWSDYQDVYLPRLGLTGVIAVKKSDPIPLGSHIKVNAKETIQYDLHPSLELALA